MFRSFWSWFVCLKVTFCMSLVVETLLVRRLPVQLIACKDSSPNCPITCRLRRRWTHSFIHSLSTLLDVSDLWPGLYTGDAHWTELIRPQQWTGQPSSAVCSAEARGLGFRVLICGRVCLVPTQNGVWKTAHELWTFSKINV